MRYALLASGLFLALTPPAEAQLLRRLFGGGRQVQVQQSVCYQQPTYYAPTYAPTYAQPNYQVVAAVPLATIPLAVDLQAYAYSVNAAAFQSFRDYQAQKVAQVEATPVPGVAAAAAPVSSNSGGELTGAVILKQQCLKCHQQGNSPKSGFAMFDAKGDLYANLPFGEMLERITSAEPEARMPPGKTLAPHDVMAVFRLASSGIGATQERVAAVEPTKPRNPFE